MEQVKQGNSSVTGEVGQQLMPAALAVDPSLTPSTHVGQLTMVHNSISEGTKHL